MPAQTSVRNLNEKFEGAYRTANSTGLITTIAAGTDSAGHIWAARWAPVTTPGSTEVQKRRFAIVQRFRARVFTIAGFTGAQEFSVALFKLTGYTAGHTGGVGATVMAKKRTAHPTAIMTGRYANTAELTDGTHDALTLQLGRASYAELAAAATVPKGAMEVFLSTEDLAQYPLVLAPNEGLVLRNEVLMGAGGTARVVVEMDWLEVERY